MIVKKRKQILKSHEINLWTIMYKIGRKFVENVLNFSTDSLIEMFIHITWIK